MLDVAANNREQNVASVTPPEDDERWRLAQRISTSASFSRSPRLARLLIYLCEQAILDRRSMLTEQNLAHAVFERKGKFDPAADTIVRSQMLRLRQRLEAYFDEEGQNERIRVTIPKGGYVPLFEEMPDEPAPKPARPDAAAEVAPIGANPHGPTAESAGSRRTIRRLWGACTLLLALCVSMLLYVVVNRAPEEMNHAGQTAIRHRFWSELFVKGQKTTIVAADSGIVMLHGGTGKNTTLAEYLSRNFSKELGDVSAERQKELINDADRRYTSFVDLELINRITHIQEANNVEYVVRFARDISVNDFKNGNLILSGSKDADPWLELFEPQMNFVLHDDLIHGVRGFLNTRPKAGESLMYTVVQDEYGVLAMLPNLSNTGNVLIIEGTSVAGTQAISDFAFMSSDMDAFLKKIARPDGAIPPFEILLQSHPLEGSSSRSQIVSYRLH